MANKARLHSGNWLTHSLRMKLYKAVQGTWYCMENRHCCAHQNCWDLLANKGKHSLTVRHLCNNGHSNPNQRASHPPAFHFRQPWKAQQKLRQALGSHLGFDLPRRKPPRHPSPQRCHRGEGHPWVCRPHPFALVPVTPPC